MKRTSSTKSAKNKGTAVFTDSEYVIVRNSNLKRMKYISADRSRIEAVVDCYLPPDREVIVCPKVVRDWVDEAKEDAEDYGFCLNFSNFYDKADSPYEAVYKAGIMEYNGYYSCVIYEHSYTGQVHSDAHYYSTVFDKHGNVVSLKDIGEISDNTVSEVFMLLEEKNIQVSSEFESKLRSASEFVIRDGYVIVIFDPGTVASYEAGAIYVRIPFKDLKKA